MSRDTKFGFCRSTRIIGSALLSACWVLSGCTSLPERHANAEAARVGTVDAPAAINLLVVETSVAQTPTLQIAPEEHVQEVVVKSEPIDVWSRIRADEESLECNQLTARATRWLNYFVQHADQVETDLERAMPLINLVDIELAQQGLPALFAMLPMVESRYLLQTSTGNRAAGIWQLMPITARGLGLPVQRDYDGRLDTLAATQAAARLLAHLADAFDRDWRLMNMAFNAGEFRVKAALRKHPARASAPETLELSKITLHHLAKLKALTCFIKDAAHYGIQLPDANAPPALDYIALDQSIELGFLAHLAQTDVAALRRLNPALRGTHTPVATPIKLLLPQAQATKTREALSQIPANEWRRWTKVTAANPAARARLIAEHAAQVDTVLAINKDATESILWLPVARNDVKSVLDDLDTDGRHVVSRGDTLWALARQYGVSIALLMRWNGLSARSLLKPGDRLRIAAPEL